MRWWGINFIVTGKQLEFKQHNSSCNFDFSFAIKLHFPLKFGKQQLLWPTWLFLFFPLSLFGSLACLLQKMDSHDTCTSRLPNLSETKLMKYHEFPKENKMAPRKWFLGHHRWCDDYNFYRTLDKKNISVLSFIDVSI